MRFLVLGLLVACTGGGSGGDPNERIFDSVGRMCVFSGAPSFEPMPQSFVADGEVTIRVELAGHCLSSSCDVDRTMTCEVSGLAVTSHARFLDLTEEMGACTDDCGILSTTCCAGALPAGTHDVTFGGQVLTLTVPSDPPEQPCVDAQ